MPSVVKLDLGQLRQEILPRLLKIDLFPAGEDVERSREARAPCAKAAGGQPLAEETLELCGVALAQRRGPADLAAQVGGKLVCRRRAADRGTIEGRGSAGVAARCELIRLHDQR